MTPIGRAARRKRILTNCKLTLVCLGLIWIGAVLRKPFLIADRLRDDNTRLEKKAMDLKIDFQNKEKELVALEAPGGMEKEARRLGYVKKGEVLLVIPNK
jgi:hypothetical protein